MNYQLSVLVPGIRPDNWEALYKSILKSFSGMWEIIFIGPYPLPERMLKYKNVRYIEDWGSPIRCQQRALYEAKGDWITWAADDGEFKTGKLDLAFDKLKKKNFDYMSVIMGKYREGSGNTDPMVLDQYYMLNNHEDTKSEQYPADTLMLNVGVVSRQLLLEVGGWDAEKFEVCPMAYNDLAVRLQRHGAKFIIQDEVMFLCSHLPGHEGDHGPIHNGQQNHDRHVYALIWKDFLPVDRLIIQTDNWKNAPERWERRFGKA